MTLKVNTFKRSRSDSDNDEVFSNLTLSELKFCLVEILEKSQKLQQRGKNLNQIHVVNSGAYSELLKENSILKEKVSNIENEIYALKSKSKNLRK